MAEYTAADVAMMQRAIACGRQCTSVERAYNVGAVIASGAGAVLSSGYSRQLPGNTHAEQCALEALPAGAAAAGLEDATMYTTMEPCSTRLSGNTPCVQRILDAGIRRVCYGVREPPTFVDCRGVQLLAAAGVRVVHVAEAEADCRKLNAHIG
ncbi:hypothetical protein H4R18_000888 [Coemansia javaensis]|uniref:CMP/dCMP-type deaminase domain-containing protein n=1 Tax=Coemansia javaensis TaxID=2761396 RepID=A0A9W8LL27_9FUNG|nr:hypothetical protein H4R18_000888 [Coemansia javaensis]